MNSFLRISKLIFYLLFLYTRAASQNDTIAFAPEPDSSSAVRPISKHAFYSGVGYGSSMIYQGSSIPMSQTSGYAALMYGYKNKLFASVSAFKIAESDQLPDFYSYSLNYVNGLNKWLDMSLALSSVHFNSNLSDTLLHNFIYTNITAGINWKFLYANISCSGVFSEKSRYYYQVKTSGYFQTPGFFKDKAYLSFNPYVNLLLGSYLKESRSYITATFTTYDTLTVSSSYTPPAIKENTSGQSSSESDPISVSPVTVTPVTTNSGTELKSYSKAFGLMEINLGLPVAINFKKAEFEIEAGYVVPCHSSTFLPAPKGFIFRMSMFFRIL
jgi:hypothetical protein